jgi:hypothetical protein
MRFGLPAHFVGLMSYNFIKLESEQTCGALLMFLFLALCEQVVSHFPEIDGTSAVHTWDHNAAIVQQMFIDSWLSIPFIAVIAHPFQLILIIQLHHFDFLLVVLSEPLMRTRRFMRH